MNILVTGGAGFIGSNLTDKLLSRGDKVIIIDNFNDFYDPRVKRNNIASALENKHLTLYEGDITDRGYLSSILDNQSIDCVCHIAARAGVRPSLEDPVLYEKVNCIGTLNILEAIKTRPIQNFVFASSSSVYGINSKVPFSEDDPIEHPISPYATTKRSNELMLFSYSHLYSIPTTCLRFFTVYGKRGRPDMAVAKFTELISSGKPVRVFGDGGAQRDFTYIDDITDGILSSIDKPSRFEIINLGNSRVVSVNYLISLLEENLDKKANVVYSDPIPGDVPLTFADISKAGRLLGYDPRTPIEEGVKKYVEWCIRRKGT